MNTTLKPAPVRADHPTAPLSSAARSALRRLELRLALPAGIAEAVVQHETAAVHAAGLAAKAASGEGLRGIDVRSWEFAEELMTGARATLTAAGMLHLVMADDHGKTKDPLPQRPRGPHPYRAGVA